MTFLMSKKILTLKTPTMVATAKGRNIGKKVLSCSTPENESPSRDSDSICDSDASSPVPFLCTQDGIDGETDVIWNYYTPKSDNQPNYRFKNSTPLSRKFKKASRQESVEKPQPRRRFLRSSLKKNELFQDLIELNQNVNKLFEKNNEITCNSPSDKDDSFFNISSPTSGLKTNKKCLRKNLLSSKFSKQDPEPALESDDSMNECLLRASQMIEEKLNFDCIETRQILIEPLKEKQLQSPNSNKKVKINSPCIYNDSFDNFMGNLNDSTLDKLTQMPVKIMTPKGHKISTATSEWDLQDMRIIESPSSKNLFGRHNSMPESPSVSATSKPSTSGMIFGRHNSMPFHENTRQTGGDSPIRCTPDEIRKKHTQAREKLLAKRLLPFTSTQLSSTQSDCAPQPKRPRFQPKVANTNLQNRNIQTNTNINIHNGNNQTNIKEIIEKKRQEALMKLRKKQGR